MPNELREMLFGTALCNRDDTHVGGLAEDLNACLRGVMDALLRDVGRCDGFCQALLEWTRVIEMPATFEGVSAKRAALLFALHHQPAVSNYFRHSDGELVEDLVTRVLPVTIPSFVAGMGQCPESLLLMVLTMCELWPQEPLGMIDSLEPRY